MDAANLKLAGPNPDCSTPDRSPHPNPLSGRRYVERFKSPVHAELLGRLICGNTVVDREVITGLPEDAEADCMATYVVRDGLISKIQFVWRPRVKP